MKITLEEHGQCFAIEMTAETMTDAALLARLGMNYTNEIRSVQVDAKLDGSFTGCVVIGKTKKHNSTIVKRK